MRIDVFVNYRSADAAFGAAATYELLAERLGRERIFLDNQSMLAGDVYPLVLRSALESMQVLLVLIGPTWLADDPAGNGDLLIERDSDWVRCEIRRALERAVTIVPVLLDGAALPDPEALPADIRGLTHHQVAEVRHRHLGVDVRRLADRIAGLLGERWVGERPIPHQLPADGGPIVGRADDLAALDSLVRSPNSNGAKVVVISGPPGVGKTSLAVHWAHRALDAFPGGQMYVDLHGYGTERPLLPAQVLARMLRALGMDRPEELTGLDERATRYRELLAQRRILVVLDNAKTVAQVRPLLPGAGPSAAVVTSRQELGGLVVRFAAEHIRLQPLRRAEAVELLRTTIGNRVEIDLAATAALAAYCGYLPLALRIAAERTGTRPSLSMRDVVSELTDTGVRLDRLDSGDPHAAVRSVFSWSYLDLDRQCATAFRALGAHPGTTLDLHAAAALTGVTPPAAARVVTALVDAHLVIEQAPGRYVMHDLLRIYARELAAERVDERRSGQQRLFDHYLHTAGHADRVLTPHRFRVPLDGDGSTSHRFGSPSVARRWLEREEQNLLAVCRLDEPEFDGRRWQLAYVLRGYFYLTKRIDGWIDTHTQALAASRRLGDERAEAMTRNNLGMALVAAGNLREAAHNFGLAEHMFQQLDDARGVANAQANLASVLRRQGALEDALTNLGKALASYRQVESKHNAGITLRSMAKVHIDAGRSDEAVRCAQEAVDVALGLDHALDVAQAFNVLAAAHHLAGNIDPAEFAARQANDFSVRCGSRHEEARAARRLGTLAAESGRVDDARQWLEDALMLYREAGAVDADSVAQELLVLSVL